MKILMVSSECTPLAKTGGLADAVAGLSRALSIAGHDVRILIPHYATIDADNSLSTTFRDGSSLRECKDSLGGAGLFLHHVPTFDRIETIYTGDNRDAARFIALSFAAARFGHATNWQPDIIHCHDWHAALVPDVLRFVANDSVANAGKAADTTRTSPAKPLASVVSTVLTLHNIGYQGIFANAAIPAPGWDAFLRQQLHEESAATVNFLKLGIQHATAITTVSPTYAKEILTPEFGMGLEDVIREREADLTGILNGVDYETWDPRTDPYLDCHYSDYDSDSKRTIRTALCDRLQLSPEPTAPVVGLVSRFVEQKGIDLFIDALPVLLSQTSATFAILGSGDIALTNRLRVIARSFPSRIAFKAGYDEQLAHQIVAGSDFLIIPSRYEPCGLTQLYSLRYGTIPIVRATGGLADTVKHFDPDTGAGNGCVFNDADANALIWALTTGIEWFGDPSAWQRLKRNAMREDHAWSKRVNDYIALYEKTIDADSSS